MLLVEEVHCELVLLLTRMYWLSSTSGTMSMLSLNPSLLQVSICSHGLHEGSARRTSFSSLGQPILLGIR